MPLIKIPGESIFGATQQRERSYFSSNAHRMQYPTLRQLDCQLEVALWSPQPSTWCSRG
jgi:hypothetical protein